VIVLYHSECFFGDGRPDGAPDRKLSVGVKCLNESAETGEDKEILSQGFGAMMISEQQVNSEVIIEKMEGRFDQNARQEYKWRMDLAINAGYRHIILDVTDVTFIDSTALGWLVLTQRKFNRVRGKMSLIVRDGFVRDILNLTEIGEWIPVFRSREEAIASFGQRTSEEVNS